MKTLKDLERDFKRKSEEYKKFERDLPKIVGAVAVKVFRQNFKAGGFIEKKGEVQEWSERDEKTNYGYDNYKTYKGSVYSSSNPILKQTGNLRSRIKVRSKSTKAVFIGVNISLVAYAKFVNERIRNGKQDKYIGKSEYLEKQIHSELTKRRKKIFGAWIERISGIHEGESY